MKKGFTLIELLVVISIISLLTSIVLSSLSDAKAKARDVRRMQDLAQIRNAVELYINDHNGNIPASNGYFMQVTNTNGTYHQIKTAMQPYFSSIPVDPLYPGYGGDYQQINYWYYYGNNYKLINGTITNTPGTNTYLLCSKMEKNKKNYITPWGEEYGTLDYCVGSN